MSLEYHWKLDGDLIDSVRRKRAIEHGTVSYATAKFGQGLSLDGTANTGAELLQHADADTLQSSNNSVSLWFKSTSTTGVVNSRVISRDFSDYFGFMVDQGTSFPQSGTFYIPGWTNQSVSIQQDTFHNIIINFNNSQSEITVFFDGNHVYTGAWTGFPSTAAKPIVLGGNTEGDGDISGHEFIGLIDDVRFYNHAVSKKEAKEIYRAKLLHYKFDVFSEWTENVVTNTNLDTGWSKGYTQNILWNDIDPPAGINSPVVSFENDDTGGAGYWFSYGDYAPQADGTTYTVSLWVKTNQTTNVSIKFYTADNNETDRYNSELRTVNASDGWKRIVWNSFTTANPTDSDSLSFRYENLYESGFTRMWLCAPQMEAKSYATPYVHETGQKGQRSTVIRDSSYQHNDAELGSDTPKWIEDSAVGSGAYFFNTNSIVAYKDLSLTGSTPFSILAWYKGGGTVGTILSLNYNTSPYRGIDLITDGGVVRTHIISTWDTDAIKVSSDSGGASYLPVNDGNWNLVGLTYDGSKNASGVNIYINAVLQEKIANVDTLTSDTILYPGAPIRIGGRTDSSGNINLAVSGNVDEPQVLSYELSQSEMEKIYKQKASIDSKGGVFTNNFQEPSHYDSLEGIINLVENGKAQYESNYNFSSFTYVTSDYVSSPGSFERTGYNNGLQSNNLIKVNAREGEEYELSGFFKNTGAEQGNFYFGVACYDINGSFIAHQETSHVVSTETTLAQELNDGDTVVYLTSSANWSTANPGGYDHRQRIGTWGSLSNYQKYTYTKAYDNYIYVDNASANTLTLESQWSRGTVPAGTPVANMFSGGTYNYIAAANEAAPNDWGKFSGTIGDGWNINEATSQFRYGTEFIKILFLINRNTTNPTTTLVDNVRFYNTSKEQRNLFKQFNIQMPTKEGIVSFENFVEVGRPQANNILDYTGWSPGTVGSQTGFNRNGGEKENRIDYGVDPFGKSVPVWACIPDIDYNADGGWNTDRFTIDITKTYRSSVWVKRVGGHDGRTYHGCDDLLNLNGTSNTNPYFWSGDPPTNAWYLLVGIIHPNGYAGGDTGVSGVYNRKGEKVLDGTEFQAIDDSVYNQRQRAYYYYNDVDISVRQYFVYPRFEVVDGTEPTIKELANGYDSREYYKNSVISQGNNGILSVRGQIKEV